MSFFQLATLEWRKFIRSIAAGRKLASSIVLGIFAIIILLYVLAVGVGLPYVITRLLGQQDVVGVINTYSVFFFLMEMMYRFFLQKNSTFELSHFLHLPVGRPKIIHFLLCKSFLSSFNLVVILLFAPSCFMEIGPTYGTLAGLSWLWTIIFLSWSVHWFMLWFEQAFGDGIAGILGIFAILLLGGGTAWLGVFNVGVWTAPFFTTALQSPLPLLLSFLLMIGAYALTYRFYATHAYLEEINSRNRTHIVGDQLSLFGRFGLAGAMADLELKLALRHRRSRMSIIISFFFLGYGLIFYGGDSVNFSEGIPALAIFIGIFITGVFIMQYGQLFLSWNASHFDFFLGREGGIRALIRGKYLLFLSISLLAYILSIPYVYFGWPVLLIHTATFLFNIGISLQAIIYLALWKPKPMDLNKRGMFNYEGMGAAQFLMAIPMLGLPYLIYLPLAWFFSDIIGLMALVLVGFIGLIFHEQFINFHVQRIRRNRYAISSSFRQEI